MKSLVASAPVVVGKKEEILRQFRSVLYSNTEEVFKVEDGKFVELCGDITVKTGSNQDSLADYYIRNWRQCKEMWVRCYRKTLPCLGDNTSNRVERYFWTLKKALQDTFLSLPKTIRAAIYLVKFVDQRLDEKYIFASNKALIIYDKDPQIRELNAEASKWLNDRGCILFHAAQKRLADVKEKLAIDDDKVIEEFSGGSRNYNTTLTSCSCSFASTHQAPCAHILYMRAENQEEFSPEAFHPRYHRSSGLDMQAAADFSANTEQNVPDVSDDENNNEAEEEMVLNDRQKYARVMPILLRIGNLISCHPNKKFLQYMDALNELERRVRKGQNFMLLIQNILAQSADVDEDDEDDEIDQEEVAANLGDNVTSDTQDTVVQDESQDNIEADVSAGPSSRKRKFEKIVFKQGLKTKGRPKKRSLLI